MIGVTTLADARRYDLGTASLLTYTKPGTPAAFTSAAGMTFVAPSDAALRNAAALLVPDKKNLVWDFPYTLFGKDSPKVAAAYPGAMLVYADIPTHGLPKVNAADFAQFLDFAAGVGQTPGSALGDLPSGYLPLTSADHLADEAAYTVRAAQAVSAQKSDIPSLFPPKHSSPTPSKSPSTSPSTSPSSPGGGTGGSTSPGSSSSPDPSTSITSANPSASQSTQRIALSPVANFGLVGYLLPLLAGLAIIAAALALLLSRLGRSRSQ